jgi:manganese efflux pump family protein
MAVLAVPAAEFVVAPTGGKTRTRPEVPGTGGYVSDVLALFVVALTVGLDNFAAATAIGVSGADWRLRLRVAVVFGAFEATMPILGLLLGRAVATDLGDTAKLVAGLVLVATGVYTIVSEFVGTADDQRATDLSVKRLAVLGAALSLDNLAIGFALGTYHVNIAVAIGVFAVVSVGFAILGLEVGRRLGQRLGRWSDVVAGAILVLVGIAIASGLL